MSNIVQIISNIKHNGKDYLAGEFVEVSSDQVDIVESGAAKILKGVSTIEQAMEIYGKEEVVEVAEEVQEANTWEAKPDPVEAQKDEMKSEAEGGPNAPQGTGKAPAEEETKLPEDTKVADVIDDTKL